MSRVYHETAGGRIKERDVTESYREKERALERKGIKKIKSNAYTRNGAAYR